MTVDPSNPHATPERAWTAYLVPAGTDVFTVRPDQIRELTVPARNALDVSQHAEVRKVAARGFYVIDTIIAGSVSSIVRGIVARARDQQNADERRAWEAGESGHLIRSIGISRPLGG